MSNFSISLKQVNDAISAAAPPPGKEWQSDAIARNIAELIDAEAARLKADADEWEQGRGGFELNIVPANVRKGAIGVIEQWQQATIAKHAAFVKQRLDKNRAIIGGIFTTITALGGAAITGGMTTPALVSGLFGVATQIADALNSAE